MIKPINRLIALFAAVFTLCGATVGVSAKNNTEEIMSGVYFFGDSTTAHLAVRGGIPKERVWSGCGSTLLFTSVLGDSVDIGGETTSIFDAVGKFKPKILVITVGASGGAGFLKEDDFKRIYAEMLIGISRSSPKTKIIAQSILPLSDKSVKYYKKLTKEAVVKANGWIEEVCGDLGVDYLPTHDLLTDDNGYLKTEYQNDEYLHLTSAAYEIILKNLENHISNNIDEFK